MSDPVQSPKVLIVTALITAMTTIGVAFIGIFPQLRSGDVENLKNCRKTLRLLSSRPASPSTLRKILPLHRARK